MTIPVLLSFTLGLLGAYGHQSYHRAVRDRMDKATEVKLLALEMLSGERHKRTGLLSQLTDSAFTIAADMSLQETSAPDIVNLYKRYSLKELVKVEGIFQDVVLEYREAEAVGGSVLRTAEVAADGMVYIKDTFSAFFGGNAAMCKLALELIATVRSPDDYDKKLSHLTLRDLHTLERGLSCYLTLSTRWHINTDP